MAREFGIKSYKPENVSFIKSGTDGTDGSPWSKLRTKLAKNILLEAYHNPSTIEELSLELGVAAPYMEEAVESLVNAELLKKLDGGKYETDFMILNADAQKEMENAKLKIKDEYFAILKKQIDTLFDKTKKDGKKLYGGYQSFDELKWWYILRIVDIVNLTVDEEKYPAKNSGYTKRPHGGAWDIMGMEEFTGCPESFFIGLNGSGEDFGGANLNIYDFRSDWGKRWA